VSKNTSSEKAYSYRRGAPPAAFSRGLKREVAAMGNNITVVNPQSKLEAAEVRTTCRGTEEDTL